MSVNDSNLSDSKYGYDLVVAVTQSSVNATLKRYLDNLKSSPVTFCYKYNNNNDVVLCNLDDFTNALQGKTPFDFPSGTDINDESLKPLIANGFACAVRATIGLPPCEPSLLPPIVTLGQGTDAPISFNLLFKSFDVVAINYGPKDIWTNASQGNDPWYLTSQVYLNRGATTKDDTNLPKTLKDQVKELDSKNVDFTIQTLFLDLAHCTFKGSPQVGGLQVHDSLWQVITDSFASNVKLENSLLNYNITVKSPIPDSVHIKNVTQATQQLMINGTTIENPTSDQQDASELLYLGSQSDSEPTYQRFTWNWVEKEETSLISGVLAVRREVFFQHLNDILNTTIDTLCLPLSFGIQWESDLKDDVIFSLYRGGPEARGFETIAQPYSLPGDDFVTVLSQHYESNSNPDTGPRANFSFWGQLNYITNGTVAVRGNNIRIRIGVALYLKLNHKEPSAMDPFVPQTYTDIPLQPYINMEQDVILTMVADNLGRLIVSPNSPPPTDQSANFDGDAYDQGLLGIIERVHKLFPFGFNITGDISIKKHLEEWTFNTKQALTSYYTSYSKLIVERLNSSNRWVFPANNAFLFKNIAFSNHQDLTAQLTYANPN